VSFQERLVSRLNVSTKKFALISAVLLLLDFAATSVVSAATAASYIASEVSLPFPVIVCTVIVLLVFTVICLSGVKESVRVAFAVLNFHVSAFAIFSRVFIIESEQLLTMVALIIASTVEWGQIGNRQLKINWNSGQASSASVIARQIFNGFCIGMLGLTGYECAFGARHAACLRFRSFTRQALRH